MTDGYMVVLEAYERLQAATDAGRRETLPIGPDHALWSARIARGEFGEVQVLVDLPAGRRAFRVSTGTALVADWVRVRAEDGSGEEALALRLTCSDARLHPTFVSLLGEMTDRSARSGRPCMDELTDALASWRAILAREQGRLGRSALIGLFGEVHTLIRLAARDPMSALDAWRGPDQAPHDFQRTHALEVKTLSGTGAPVISIHGVAQLDPPHGGDLHLLVLRIEESESGRTLAELFDEAAELGVPRRTLLDRAGVPSVSEDERRLTVVESRLFAVGDDFPGIRWSQLSASQRAGVENLQYGLQLDACTGERPIDDLDDILERL